MPNIVVNTTEIRSSSTSLRISAMKLAACSNKLNSMRSGLPFSEDVKREIRHALSYNAESIDETKSRVYALANALSYAAARYESVENRTQGGAADAGSGPFRGSGAAIGPGGIIGAIGSVPLIIGGIGNAVGNYISSLAGQGAESGSNGLFSEPGVSVGGERNYSLFNTGISGDYGSITVSAGNLSAQGEMGASLVSDGRLNPSAYIDLGIGISALSASGNLLYGSDTNNVFVNANGELLTANAYANGAIGVIQVEDESGNTTTQYGVQGKIGGEAYLAQGSIDGGFEIFGIKFSGTATGSAGGAGFKAGGSATTGGISGEIGVGLLVGGDVSFSIDWSGFDAGEVWDAAVDAGEAVGEFVADTGEAIGDFVDDVGDFFSSLF